MLFLRLKIREMERLFNTGKEVVKKTFTLAYASSVYLLIVNRIAKRYSGKELSFLLGQDEGFVDDLESLKRSTNDLELMVALNHIFREGELVLGRIDDHQRYPFEMSIWEEEFGRCYRMEYYLNEVESIGFFHLIDAIKYDESREKYIEERILIEVALQDFIDTDYFRKLRTPLELYHRIQVWLDRRVRPMSLKLVLDNYWGRKGKAVLRRTRQRSFGYRFQQHKSDS